MLHYAGNLAQAGSKLGWIGNPFECSVDDPMSFIRDKRMAILGSPQQDRPALAQIRRCFLDGAARGCKAEDIDLDRERIASEHLHPL